MPRNYKDITEVYGSANAKQRFRDLVAASRIRTVDVVVDHNSIGTIPAGSGTATIPAYNAAFAAKAENFPCTGFTYPNNYGGGAPPANVLFNGGVIGGVTSDVYVANRMYPGMIAHRINNGTGGNGAAYLLDPRGMGIVWGCGLDNLQWLDTAQDISAEFLFGVRPGSSGATIQYYTRSTPQIDWNTPGTLRHTESVPAASLDLAGPALVWAKLPALSLFGAYPQWIVRSDGAALCDHIGMRVRTPNKPAGWSVTPAAAGSYIITSLQTNHANIDQLSRALGVDLVIDCNEVNDAYTSGIDAATTGGNVAAKAAFWRAKTGRPDLLYVKVHAFDITNTNATNRAKFDEYAGAYADVADADPHTLVINVRKSLERRGVSKDSGVQGLTKVGDGQWAADIAFGTTNYCIAGTLAPRYFACKLAHTSAAGNAPGTSGGHLYWREVWFFNWADGDGTHPTPRGARLVADLVVEALFGLVGSAQEASMATLGGNMVNKRVTVSGTFAPVASSRTLCSGRFMLPSTNAAAVEFRFGGAGGEVAAFSPGASWDVSGIDLAMVEVRGTSPDVVQFAGGTW